MVLILANVVNVSGYFSAAESKDSADVGMHWGAAARETGCKRFRTTS